MSGRPQPSYGSYYTPTAIAPGAGKGLYEARQTQPQIKELIAANVNKLRELRTELKKEDWFYEAPRHTLR